MKDSTQRLPNKVWWVVGGAILLVLVVAGIIFAILFFRQETPAAEKPEDTTSAEETAETPEGSETTEPTETESTEVVDDNNPHKLMTLIEETKTEIATEPKILPRRNLAEKIDLQATVEAWASRYGNVGVEIYDVDYQAVVASYQANKVMYPRSIYKLFYVYDAYAQIDAGEDVNLYYANNMSVGGCLNAIMRWSDNVCAETMLGDEARASRVAELIVRLGLSSTQPDGLRTSAHDVSVLLQYYYRHPEWSNASWQKWRETALNQSAVVRRGLPSGFTEAWVYDKAGYGGSVYNDAAMVEFSAPGGVRRYIVVALTEGAGAQGLAALGASLEQAILYGI